MPREDMARELECTYGAIAHRLSILRGQGKLLRTRKNAGEPIGFPESPMPDLDKFLRLTGDWALTGDYQEPCHNAEMCKRLVAQSKRFGIHKLVIAGDFVNADAFCKFDKKSPSSWAKEIEVGGRVLGALCDQFDEIVYMIGNHEERFLRQNNWESSLLYIVRQFGLSEKHRQKIRLNCHTAQLDCGKFTYHYRHLECSGFRVTHPKNFSIIPGRVAFQLAGLFEQSVVCFHGHRAALMMSANGKHVVIEGGGMFDAGKLGYSMLQDTTHPRQTGGFTLIRDGYAHLFGPWTDWKLYESLPRLRRAD